VGLLYYNLQHKNKFLVTKKNNLYKLFFGAPENKQNYFPGSH